MRTIIGEKLSNDEVQDIIRDIDLNGDGEVDYEGLTIAYRVWIG